MKINEDVEFLLKDKRNCRSRNMQAFFRSKNGRRMSQYLHVIRFEGKLWFATLGWLVTIGRENGFAGVRVQEVACWGAKATTGYPVQQQGGDYEDVTEWFWEKYRERGVISIPEIWHRDIPLELSHAELHTV